MLHTDTQISWQDYLAIVFRRRWFFVIPCAAVIIGAFAIGMCMPRIFRAETVILVQEPQIMNPLIQGLAVSTPVGERLRGLREEMLGWTSLLRLVHELQLDGHAKTPAGQERLIKDLQKDIEVRMSSRDIIHIYYEHQDPKLAQKLVNTITTIFLQRNMEAQKSETGTAINFIDQELDQYKKQLETSEQALREFKEIYVTQMPVAVELNKQVIDMEVDLAQRLVDSTEEHPGILNLRRRIKEMKEKRNEQVKRLVASAIVQGRDPTMYDSLLRALGQPAAEGAPDDPNVKHAQEAYASLLQQLENNTPIKPLGMQVQVVNQSDPMKSGGVSSEPVSISLGPWQEQELARLTRDYETGASTYQHLRERRERAKITQDLGDSDNGLKFKILEPARVPLHPVKPNMVKIMAFALFLGVFLGSGVAFVAEYLDQSFTSASDLQEALELPVLGTISRIITEQDLNTRRHRLTQWLSPRHWRQLGRQVGAPIANRLNAFLLKHGL